MSREVRRVPANWEHPKDEKGNLIPLFDGSFKERAAKWDEEAAQWEKGFYHLGGDEWKPKGPDQTGTFEDWDGARPEEKDYMPDWPEAERTHYQMYETTTEGTPISPVMETPEALARWLADNNASAFAGMGARPTNSGSPQSSAAGCERGRYTGQRTHQRSRRSPRKVNNQPIIVHIQAPRGI